MLYRYRILISSVIFGIIVNALLAYTDCLLVRTATLEITSLFVFLALFAKRGIKKQETKHEEEGIKIYL